MINTNGIITVEVLLNGSSSQIIALPNNYRFTSEELRDAYFAYHSSELVYRTWIMVEDELQQWNGTEWVSFTEAIVGPSGESFKVVAEVPTVEDLPDPEIVAYNEGYLVSEFSDGKHLFLKLSSTNEWVDQGNIIGPPGKTPLFEIRENGHLYAIYED